MGQEYSLLQPMGVIRENFYNTPVCRRWGDVLRGCVPSEDSRIERELFLLPQRKCFFLCGPAGTGKRQLATALAGTLQVSYQCFTVRGRRLRSAQTEALEDCVDELIARAEEQSTFLLLEQPSRYPAGVQLLELLMEELEACGNGLPLILVVCETDPAVFHPEWQDLMMYLPFSLPDQAERKEFFEETFQQERRKRDKAAKLYHKFPRDRNLSLDRMAEETKGFNYNQLLQLVNAIKLALVSQGDAYGSTAQELLAAIKGGQLVCTAQQFTRMVETIRQSETQPKAQATIPNQDYSEVLARLLQSAPASVVPGRASSRTASSQSQEQAKKDENGAREFFTDADINYFK
ncbi:MAG: AAA family ATPase [Candidatus Onthomonas sp.]